MSSQDSLPLASIKWKKIVNNNCTTKPK